MFMLGFLPPNNLPRTSPIPQKKTHQTGNIPELFRTISGTCPNKIRFFPEHFRKQHREHFQNIPEHFRDNFGIFPKSSEIVPETIRTISRTFPDMFQNISGNFAETIRNCSGTHPETIRKKSDHFSRTCLS